MLFDMIYYTFGKDVLFNGAEGEIEWFYHEIEGYRHKSCCCYYLFRYCFAFLVSSVCDNFYLNIFRYKIALQELFVCISTSVIMI